MTQFPRDLRAMAVSAHPIRLCIDCRHQGQACLPGLMLMGRLTAAIDSARPGAEFEISGTAQITACSRPCQIAWRATAQGAWVFGDVADSADLEDLVAGARRAEQGMGQAQVPGSAAAIVSRAGAVS